MSKTSDASHPASVVFLTTGRPSLVIDGDQLFEADYSVLPPLDKDEVAAAVARLRQQQVLRPVPFFGLSIRRQLRLALEHAAEHADVSNKTEFWDLLDLIMGLGVKARDLADELELQPEMISRYRGRVTAPAKVRQRRDVLRAALDLAPAPEAASENDPDPPENNSDA